MRWVVAFLVCVSSAMADTSLTLDAYLRQVKGKNTGIQGAIAESQGAIDISEMGSLLLAPTLFAGVQLQKDKRKTLVPAFQGTETDTNTYSLGISKLTSFGLEGKLSYNIGYTNVVGASPAFLQFPTYHDAYPKIELTQSLWRNFLGAQTRANEDLHEAQSLATGYSSSFRVKTLLADAEGTYWTLVFAREAVNVQRDSLERAGKIRDWNHGRVKLNLTDRSDLLQAEAALKSRELELQSALDDERSASRAFNSARGLDSDSVLERLALVDTSTLESAATKIVREPLRDDVKAAQQQERAAVAAAESNLQTLSPDLQLYGNYSFNGRNVTLSESTSESFKSNYPLWTVGLRLIAPLDLPTIFRSRDGAKLQRLGAEKTYDRRLFEQEQEWKQLNIKLEESTRRLALARMIEDAQRQKLLFEKTRLNRGRSTTYQVLLFEQDYANAQLKRIQTQAEVLRIVAQLKTFRGAS